MVCGRFYNRLISAEVIEVDEQTRHNDRCEDHGAVAKESGEFFLDDGEGIIDFHDF